MWKTKEWRKRRRRIGRTGKLEKVALHSIEEGIRVWGGCSSSTISLQHFQSKFFHPVTFHSKTTIPTGLSCYCIVANSDHLADINTFIALVKLIKSIRCYTLLLVTRPNEWADKINHQSTKWNPMIKTCETQLVFTVFVLKLHSTKGNSSQPRQALIYLSNVSGLTFVSDWEVKDQPVSYLWHHSKQREQEAADSLKSWTSDF